MKKYSSATVVESTILLIHGFLVAGLPAMGSSILSCAASTSARKRGLFEMLPVSCYCVVLFLFPGSLTRLY